MLSDFYKRKCTIYCLTPAKQNAPTTYKHKFTIDRCFIADTVAQKAAGTTIQYVNGDTVQSKDLEHYREPSNKLGTDTANYSDYGFYAIPALFRNNYYTFGKGDLLVYGDVDDPAPENAAEFTELKNRYKTNSMIIQSASNNIYGLRTDHVERRSV